MLAAQTVTVPPVGGLIIIAAGLLVAGIVLGMVLALAVKFCRKRHK
jgi:hypothetical protein